MATSCRSASDRRRGATVIQRADVDNVFGRIEAVLGEFLNKPYYDLPELYRRSQGLTITGRSGAPAPAFFASAKAAPPFPQVGLADKKGGIIAAPFVKTPMDRVDEYDGPVDVEGELVFSVPALAVSLIKSAHLALFRLMGYRWVFDPAGQYVGRQLATVVEGKADADAVKHVAHELPNCFSIVPGQAGSEDTLVSRRLVLHFDYYDGSEHPLEHGMDTWGVSCLFNVNEHQFIVTLPFTSRLDGLTGALERYRSWLSEPCAKHTGYECWVRSDGELEHSRTGFNITAGSNETAFAGPEISG